MKLVIVSVHYSLDEIRNTWSIFVCGFLTALPDFLKAIVKFLRYEKRFLILYDNTNNVILDKKNCLFLKMSWKGLLLYNDVLFTKKILEENNSVYMEYDGRILLLV